MIKDKTEGALFQALATGEVVEFDLGNEGVLYDVKCTACGKWLCGDGVKRQDTAVRRYVKHAAEKHS